MSNTITPYEDKELRKEVFQVAFNTNGQDFYPDTYKELEQLITKKQLEAERQGNEDGFHAAMGMCGVEQSKVAGFYKLYRDKLAELNKQEGKDDDLFERVLELVPHERLNDVVFIDVNDKGSA